MKVKIYSLLVLALVLLAFAYGGTIDHDNEVYQNEQYCNNVYNGVWPDYKKGTAGDYNHTCVGPDARAFIEAGKRN